MTEPERFREANASLRAERGQLCEACGTAEAEIHDEAGAWCEPCEDARCAGDAQAAGLPESFCRRLEQRA